MTIDTQQLEAVALLPCPFCGGSNIITWDPFSDTGDEQLVAHCNDCLADGPNAGGVNDSTDEAEAIAAWNRRAAPTPPSAMTREAMMTELARLGQEMDYETPSADPTAQTGADDDGPCTDCGDTGITFQTERRCACQPLSAQTSADDALERWGVNWKTGGTVERMPDGYWTPWYIAQARITALSQPVPSEPTEAMIEAGKKTANRFGIYLNPLVLAAIYRAMLTAGESSDG
jgi:Lar family restriction alleviation protein